MNQKRKLSICPYCHKEGIDTVGDALANTTCSICNAELIQEEVWYESQGPGKACPQCGQLLESEYTEKGCFAICPNNSCDFVEACNRKFIIIEDGDLPYGVRPNDPDSWEPIDEPTDDSWMVDQESEDDLSEGDDNIIDHRRPVNDIVNDPLYKDILMIDDEEYGCVERDDDDYSKAKYGQ